ncbi:hypothetical protein FXW07_00095 [Methanosarcina sp. DH1]|uniref:hypothetical protein n=1 Tax=Methanosarcina sp. DH1 TaxID=2605695 RepID=UPI001E5C8DFD|nr:hypothetical protein [Methanosarcina sp. DH1]MCC4765087.1 hypothetical protein [Methanosarcina sp. DH1]
MIGKDDISKSLDKINLKWVKLGVIINFVMLLIVIIQLFNVQIPMPSFEKKEYQIYNTDPKNYPLDLSLLNTSPVYYVVMEVKNPDADYGTMLDLSYLRFSIDTANKGKNSVEDPEYRILICDPLGRIRGMYPKGITSINNFDDLLLTKDDISLKESEKELNFIFKMPPEDQKILGNWRIYIYLLDNNSNSLVSYNIQDIRVIENKSANSIYDSVSTLFIFGTIMIMFADLIRNTISKRKRDQK